MKHAAAWVISLALIFPQFVNAEGIKMTQDQQNVLAAVEHMTKSFQANDIASVMESYENEATVVFEPDSPTSDRDQLEQMFAGMASVSPVFNYPSGHEVIVNGDIALHISPWTMSGKTPDGKAMNQEGLSVSILRKQEDGSWKLVIDNPHGSRLLSSN